MFACYVQSDTQYRVFSPGQSWWLVAESNGLESILRNTVTLMEQIGITIPEMKPSFGRYWKRNIEQVSPSLQSQQHFFQVPVCLPETSLILMSLKLQACSISFVSLQ
jgi:hypothetical protein